MAKKFLIAIAGVVAIMAALILAAILTPRIGKSLIPVMTALIAFGWMGY